MIAPSKWEPMKNGFNDLVVKGPLTRNVCLSVNVICEWTFKAALEARGATPFSLTRVNIQKKFKQITILPLLDYHSHISSSLPFWLNPTGAVTLSDLNTISKLN